MYIYNLNTIFETFAEELDRCADDEAKTQTVYRELCDDLYNSVCTHVYGDALLRQYFTKERLDELCAELFDKLYNAFVKGFFGYELTEEDFRGEEDSNDEDSDDKPQYDFIRNVA